MLYTCQCSFVILYVFRLGKLVGTNCQTGFHSTKHQPPSEAFLCYRTRQGCTSLWMCLLQNRVCQLQSLSLYSLSMLLCLSYSSKHLNSTNYGRKHLDIMSYSLRMSSSLQRIMRMVNVHPTIIFPYAMFLVTLIALMVDYQ